MNTRQFVVTAEVRAPRGSDNSGLLERIEIVKDYCDAINIPDNPRRIASMSSMACSRMVIESEKEPVMQIALRDRNRIALESDLYGAH
ncbi:MAG: methylenetetrahydrofolate reductase, partial [Candidatus Thorarchaeota archaeon]